MPRKPILMLDTECYPTHWCACFRNPETGNERTFELHGAQPLDKDGLRRVMQAGCSVSFNGNHYDMPMISHALSGATNAQLKTLNDRIIVEKEKHWDLGIKPLDFQHIDLSEVAPGVRLSLKTYGGRLHSKKLQDLPFSPDKKLTSDEWEIVKQYCMNDLALLYDLYLALRDPIDLRTAMSERYDLDLMSKSDAQIAEAVIVQEAEAIMKREIGKPKEPQSISFYYSLPEYIQFKTEALKDVLRLLLNTQFFTNEQGKLLIPTELRKLTVTLGKTTYQLGIGGLHSTEKNVFHESDEHNILIDRDVASYYPMIILNNQLEPPQLANAFTSVFRGIVNERLDAKRSGDKAKAASLKITINGTYGKTGSPYSRLYAPRLIIQTTLTGQLSLLMLIEMLESSGIPVISANTDGVVIKCPRSKFDLMEFIVWEWEQSTRFETESTEYLGLYSRDINNYLAVLPSGHAKAKGAFAKGSIYTHPNSDIVVTAVHRFIWSGMPVAETIRRCRDIRAFLQLRNVTGGALDQSGAYLGRTVRWYYSRRASGYLKYKTNGNKVSLSDHARALMELPEEFPDDVDFDLYTQMAKDRLVEVGITDSTRFTPLSLRDEAQAA